MHPLARRLCAIVIGLASLAPVASRTALAAPRSKPAPTSSATVAKSSTVPPPREAPLAEPPAAPSDDGAPLAEVPLPPPVDAKEAAKWERATFSGGRWVVEMLAGATVGTLSAVLMYNAAGGDIGGAAAGIVTSFAVTPLVEYGVGRAMGGRGSLSWTYVGGLIGFSGSAPAAQADPVLVIAIAEVLCPITSGLAFELTSHGAARRWQAEHGLGVAVTPLASRDGSRLGGALVTAGMRF